MAKTKEAEVTVKLTLRQASLVRGALMAYRSAIEHVAADLRPRPESRDTLNDLAEAKFAIEDAMEDASRG